MEKEIMFCDGFKEALVGTGNRFNYPVTVYSKLKMIEILKKSMSEEEALEYFDFNIAGAYIGESTPVFLD